MKLFGAFREEEGPIKLREQPDMQRSIRIDCSVISAAICRSAATCFERLKSDRKLEIEGLSGLRKVTIHGIRPHMFHLRRMDGQTID